MPNPNQYSYQELDTLNRDCGSIGLDLSIFRARILACSDISAECKDHDSSAERSDDLIATLVIIAKITKLWCCVRSAMITILAHSHSAKITTSVVSGMITTPVLSARIEFLALSAIWSPFLHFLQKRRLQPLRSVQGS